jgi:hypothetical protein
MHVWLFVFSTILNWYQITLNMLSDFYIYIWSDTLFIWYFVDWYSRQATSKEEIFFTDPNTTLFKVYTWSKDISACRWDGTWRPPTFSECIHGWGALYRTTYIHRRIRPVGLQSFLMMILILRYWHMSLRGVYNHQLITAN